MSLCIIVFNFFAWSARVISKPSVKRAVDDYDKAAYQAGELTLSMPASPAHTERSLIGAHEAQQLGKSTVLLHVVQLDWHPHRLLLRKREMLPEL